MSEYRNQYEDLKKNFPPFVTSSHSVLEQADIDPFTYPGSDFQTLVFVDGEWNGNLSKVYSLGDGCYIQSLSRAFEERPDLVKKYWKNNAAAFAHEGAFIYVPKNCVVQKPVHLLYIASEKSKEKSLYLKNFIILEEGARAEVVETYVSTHGGEYFHNVVTSIELQREAKLDHVRVQREGGKAAHVNHLDVLLGEKSNYFSNHITVGGGLTRSDIYVSFKGEGAEAEINGIFHPRHGEHVDYHVVVDHVVPRCTSKQLFKGIVEDEATGIFDGKIFVREGAQSTHAHQTNRNLLLSQNAKVYSKPHLEIYADDVKCTHGSSTGQLDAQALFYMRSRGIDENEARKILTRAFAGEVIQKIKIEKLREAIEQLVFEGARPPEVA